MQEYAVNPTCLQIEAEFKEKPIPIQSGVSLGTLTGVYQPLFWPHEVSIESLTASSTLPVL